MKATSVPPLRVPVGIEPPDTKSALQIPALNEPALPPRGPKDPCLDEPPKFTEPKRSAAATGGLRREALRWLGFEYHRAADT